jgi:hypothetical protein
MAEPKKFMSPLADLKVNGMDARVMVLVTDNRPFLMLAIDHDCGTSYYPISGEGFHDPDEAVTAALLLPAMGTRAHDHN